MAKLKSIQIHACRSVVGVGSIKLTVGMVISYHTHTYIHISSYSHVANSKEW